MTKLEDWDFAKKMGRWDLVNLLKDAGVSSVESLAIRSERELWEKLGAQFPDMKPFIHEAWRSCGWFMGIEKLVEIHKNRLLFSTGSKALDDLMGGGVYTRHLTEFAGEYAVGKSQLLFTILVEALNKYKDISAVFLDSESTYRPFRVEEIAKERDYDVEDIMKRVTYIEIPHSDILWEVIDRLDPIIENKNVKLIESDSLIAPLRAEYLGREVLWLRQQILNKFLRRFLNLARVYNLAVVIANQTVVTPQAQFIYDPVQQRQPVGGMIIGHGTDPRIHLRKAEKNKRIARLFDSSWLPEGEATFCISKRGIVDAQ